MYSMKRLPPFGNMNPDVLLSQSFATLDALRGAVVRAARYVDEPDSELISTYGIQRAALFSHAPGPILIFMADGTVVGLNSDPSRCALIAWWERDSTGGENPHTVLLSDPTLRAIESSDLRSSRPELRFDGRRIVGYRCYREQPRNALFERLPRESALLLRFDDGGEIALVHGLHDDSDDFAVIAPQQILPRFTAGWEMFHEG